MLMGFIGRMGTGKTLSMTVIGSFLSLKTGAELYSRHNVINSKTVTKPSQIWNIKNGIFLWDEMWVDMDSREWKNNIDLTRFILQSRKKNTMVMYTAQHYSQVEKRVRKATDILAFCDKYKYIAENKKENGIIERQEKTQIKLTIVEGNNGNIMKIITINDIKPFFGLYNTYEVIKTMGK